MGEVFAKGIAKSNFYDGQIMDRHRYLSRTVMSQTATKTCYDPSRGGIRKCLNYPKKVVLAGMVGNLAYHCFESPFLPEQQNRGKRWGGLSSSSP